VSKNQATRIAFGLFYQAAHRHAQCIELAQQPLKLGQRVAGLAQGVGTATHTVEYIV
jgi:hypothetical protein